MSGGIGSSVEHIDAVDALARTLYLRSKQAASSPSDDAVAAGVRQLHLALRHLRVEAADPDSLLNGPDAPVYARQLRPAVEDANLALSQLDSTLDKYEGTSGNANGSAGAERAQRLAALQNKLASQTTDIELLLDAVQLRNPLSQPRAVLDGSQTGLEPIKDKVDVIANRLFSRRDDSFRDNEDGLWQEFRSELEKEGFSAQVLRKHKDILRAYIRELESMSFRNGGAPPTVRGLLEHEAAAPKELMAFENEKSFPSMKEERRLPDTAPQLPPRQVAPYIPRRSPSSDDSGSDGGDTLAHISTRELMAMDQLAANMGSMHLQPPSQYYSVSPTYSNQKYLPSNVTGALPSTEGEFALAKTSQALSASPRSAPTLPPYSNLAVPAAYASAQTVVRLAPDPWGNDIPLDAQWTKIKRTLVSSEVLARGGWRYEARPDYVAVLGLLTREQIRDLARQSADLRAARARRQAPLNRYNGHNRADSKSSPDEDDNDSDLWDNSDTTSFDDDKTSEKGTKSYPYIVSPPDKEKKVSPASTVQPKSILKNKNENHVRFGPDPYEVESKSPSRGDRSDRHGERPPRRNRDYRDGERDRGEPRSNGERQRGGDDSYHRRMNHRERGERSDRGDRGDRGDRRGDKSSKKKAWGPALGAVGFGGAAVSLLGVLVEAASGIS